MPLKLVDEVTSLGVMLTLVGAGYGIGFAIASQVQTLQRRTSPFVPGRHPTDALHLPAAPPGRTLGAHEAVHRAGERRGRAGR